MYLTIVMPCLNEEATLGECIHVAQNYLKRKNITGEVLVVDNGSSDRSVAIAKECGARVVFETTKGYGAAVRRGIGEAKGEYVIYGDADMSYDFSALDGYIEKFEEGYIFVNGDRFTGGIEPGAMPWTHRIGVPFLSLLGRWRYKVNIRDFHSGLRGINVAAAKQLNLSCDGMEYATEIIAKLKAANMPIAEVPIVLRKDKRNRKSHLRTIRDGFRHLEYMLIKQEMIDDQGGEKV